MGQRLAALREKARDTLVEPVDHARAGLDERPKQHELEEELKAGLVQLAEYEVGWNRLLHDRRVEGEQGGIDERAGEHGDDAAEEAGDDRVAAAFQMAYDE